ncbi:MAG: protein kinase [Candidatus Riflebacteria bacterium]|nr:protein kinase [Candidatus Riflebacteria bacterium]
MPEQVINGRYKTEEVFAESYIYEVYKAKEIETGTDVVLKLMKSVQAENTDRVRMLSCEVAKFAAFSHEGVAEILDFDLWEGRPYVVTPLINGVPLNEVIENGSLSFTDALDITRQLTDVLESASEQGIESRTVKLSNVLVDADGKIKLLSFTHPRLKLASAASRNIKAAVHSDLFFLGTTMFELLTGESPLRKRGGLNELWDMKLERMLRINHPELTPKQIENTVGTVAKTLSKNISLRFDNYTELKESLSALGLAKVIAETAREEERELSMASQVVDALQASVAALDNRRLAAELSMPMLKPDKNCSNIAGSLKLSVVNGSAAIQNTQSIAESVPNRAITQNAHAHLRLVKPLESSCRRALASSSSASWEQETPLYKSFAFIIGMLLLVMALLILFW